MHLAAIELLAAGGGARLCIREPVVPVASSLSKTHLENLAIWRAETAETAQREQTTKTFQQALQIPCQRWTVLLCKLSGTIPKTHDPMTSNSLILPAATKSQALKETACRKKSSVAAARSARHRARSTCQNAIDASVSLLALRTVCSFFSFALHKILGVAHSTGNLPSHDRHCWGT